MGFRILELKLPPGFHEDALQSQIGKMLQIRQFSYQIISQSLDARKKTNIHWLIQVGVSSDELPDQTRWLPDRLEIPYKKRNKRVFIAGSGPAGFFAAFVLQKAGFETTIIERGAEVTKRSLLLKHFEKTGEFSPIANYSFGEGGAGTFSDGKLTSRSKHISKEKAFFLQTYVAAGAPPEIAWLAHPHVGSDNLRKVVITLRKQYLESGGTMLFETMLHDLVQERGKVLEALTTSGTITGHFFILAPGHSAYDTFRMLMKSGVAFRLKNFALGSRAEHPQGLINLAQWGTEKLAGVKAAEYRLTSQGADNIPVYTFCMCPGGIVVPATSFAGQNSVNGMSFYRRAGRFANASCVAGIHPTRLSESIASPMDALAWIEDLEKAFYYFSNGYQAPACTIRDFLRGSLSGIPTESSYPLGLVQAPLWSMLPENIVSALRQGLKDFAKKLKGYDQGVLLGLESKTSSPIQVLRHKNGLCEGFENLFMAGEGSGFAGGIVSSAADGIRIAMNIISGQGE